MKQGDIIENYFSKTLSILLGKLENKWQNSLRHYKIKTI